MTTDREPLNHDTLTCVKHFGCRLPECVERNKAYNRNRYHSRKQGTWQPLIDAEPVRQHLLALYAAGFTPVRVSTLAKIPFQTVVGFTHIHGTTHKRRGRKRRCTPEVAEKIFAIKIGNALPGCTTAVGTQRRIQALVAAGWPLESLGPQIGLLARSASSILCRDRVYGRTAEAFAELYVQLENERPERHGISKTSAKRARLHAQRRRWPTSTYWADRMDVIDDPDFQPLYGITRRELVAQDASWVMQTTGVDKAGAAERLGVTRSYIEHAFREYPQYALDTAA